MIFSELKVVSQQKEAEISDLKVKVDELQASTGHEVAAREDLQLHYQQRLREKHAELEQYRALDWLHHFLIKTSFHNFCCFCQVNVHC